MLAVDEGGDDGDESRKPWAGWFLGLGRGCTWRKERDDEVERERLGMAKRDGVEDEGSGFSGQGFGVEDKQEAGDE